MRREEKKKCREDEKRKKKKLRAGDHQPFLSENFWEKKNQRLAELVRLLYMVSPGT
jgi:hypothetical protein